MHSTAGFRAWSILDIIGPPPVMCVVGSMSWLQQHRRWMEQRPAEELAARYSFVVPFAALAVCFVLLKTGDLIFHETDAIVDLHTLAVCLLWLMASSVLVGILGLFSITRGTWKPVVWRAIVGIIASSLVGFLAFTFLAMEHFRQ